MIWRGTKEGKGTNLVGPHLYQETTEDPLLRLIGSWCHDFPHFIPLGSLLHELTLVNVQNTVLTIKKK